MSMTGDLYAEADELERSGRVAEAVQRWREAVRVTPSGATLARLGRLYLRQGAVDEGERLLREAIARFPNVPGAYFYLGTYYKNHGDIEEARNLLQKSVDLEEWAPALVNLGEVYRRLKEPQMAQHCFERATVLDPSDSEAWYGLGLMYRRTDEAQAREMFEKAAALDPENGPAWRELGYLAWRRGDSSTAEAHCREALRLDDLDVWAHDYLGMILESTRRDEEAEGEFRRATELWPDLPLFHCHHGDTLIRLGRHAEGEAEYKRSLSLDVNYYLANLRMGQWLKEQGRYAQARRYIERALHADPLNRQAREALSNLPPESSG
jgi:tetratricopeptide (TPR) repeat protein